MTFEETDFDIGGNGFFQFDPGNVVNFPTSFTLAGMGKDFRFIRVNEDAVLLKNGGTLALNDGKVQVACGAKIHAKNSFLVQGNRLAFEPADPEGCFYPYNYDVWAGIYTENPQRVLLSHCDFRHLRTGYAAKGIVYFATLSDCGFADCWAGVNVNNSRHATLLRAEGDQASFRFRNMAAGVALTDCDFFEGHNNEPVVHIRDVKLLWMSGGKIDGGTSLHNVGVNALLGRNNITLHEGATIQNGLYGIEMNGGVFPQTGSDWGKLTMDCARILDCPLAGVRGEDILLNIDADLNSGGGRHNEFRKNEPGSLFFDICFKDRNPGPSIMARQNYWNITQNGDSAPPSASDYNLFDSGWQQDCINGQNIPLETDPVAPGYDPDCPYGDWEEARAQNRDGEAGDACTIGEQDILDKYMTAWDSLTAAHQQIREIGGEPGISFALGAFEQIANLDSVAVAASAPLCKHLVEVARTFVEPTQVWVRQSNEQVRFRQNADGAAFPAAVRAVPNPANTGFELRLPSGDWQIDISDSFGRAMADGRFSDGVFFQTSEWAAGIYHVKFESMDGANTGAAKVFIAH